ncbi:MAG TPA: CHAD domain-containing protein, partial [Chthoniobacteraceae bacterium]|nr:CHAD domain-containing protein [Chthoniobacteraceae bacterium]
MKPRRISKSSARISGTRRPTVEGRGKVGASLQEAALERMTGTIADLERCREPTLAEATHEIRRHGKKLRALLRLVRSCLGRRVYEAEDAGLRAMGRKFGKLRDAHVRVHALDALRKRYFERPQPALLTQARRLLLAKAGRRARRLTRGDTIAVTTAALQAARTRCLGWEVQGFGWKEALGALRQSYHRTRVAGVRASAEPSIKRLHAWRKTTKELGEQVKLLHKLDPRSMHELAHELDVLSEFLGDDHDLTLLRDELTAQRAR